MYKEIYTANEEIRVSFNTPPSYFTLFTPAALTPPSFFYYFIIELMFHTVYVFLLLLHISYHFIYLINVSYCFNYLSLLLVLYNLIRSTFHIFYTSVFQSTYILFFFY